VYNIIIKGEIKVGKIILIKPDLSYANEILKDFNGQALH